MGLSQKEAKVYLAMLKLGVSTASKIAKESGVRRATTYMILDSLEEKKLALKVQKEKILFYYAEEPDKFTQRLADEERSLKNKFVTISELLPELNNIYRSSKVPPKFKILQGKEANDQVEQDISSGKIEIFYNAVPMNDFWLPFLRQKQRQKELLLHIKQFKLLLGVGKTKVKLFKHKNFEVRYIDLKKYPFASEVVIYGNVLTTLNTGKEVLAFYVENQEMAETFKQLFLAIWDKAKEYKY